VIVLLDDARRWPDLARHHRRDGLYSEGLVIRDRGAAAHRGAWLRALVQAEPTVVLGSRAVLLPGWRERLEALAVTLEQQPWHVLHLDAEQQGDAYLVTAEGAELLLEEAPTTTDLASALASVAALEVLAVDPPVAVTVAGAVRIVDAIEEAADAGDDELVLVAPPEAAVVANAFEVAVAHAVGGPVRSADGRTMLGWPDELSALERSDGEDPLGVFAYVDGPASSGLVAVDGRVLDASTGRHPAVLLGRREEVDRLRAEVVASVGDDLAALLRYDGALPIAGDLHEVGEELVSLPFWTPAFCARVVRAAEALGAWGAQDDDPVPGDEVSLSVLLPRLFAHVEDHLAAVVVPRLRQQWPTLEFHGLRDAFVIRFTPDAVGGLRLHHDVAQVSASVKLNAGYDGGELVFPRQGVSNLDVPVGHLLAWPSLVTHPHAAEPVAAGVKYSLTLWFEVPGPPG
jgi:hypothetical protein